ncbi:MAG: methyltransferase [Spirochaeta sp.]
MKYLHKALVILHWFVGTGAVFGGLAGVLDPTGASVGIDASILQRGPFTDFLIPGLFLLLVLGAGNIAVGIYLLRRKNHMSGLLSMGMYTVLVMWIIAQVYIMGLEHAVWLHWLYLGLGGAGAFGAAVWIYGSRHIQADEAPRVNLRWSYLFTGQIQHLLMLSLLVPGAVFLAESGISGGRWMGISDRQWLYFMLAAAVLHQLVVALVFRLQLMYAVLTRLFGRLDMVVWGCVFIPFFFLRPVSLLGLGLSSAGTLDISLHTSILLGGVLMLPALYTLWSVYRWFGMRRALGGDHFRRVYREMPLVTQGAFRLTSNAMYSFAFLLLWAIAIFTRSEAALAGALFQHTYIWVHWYCTEEPDMRVLYG